MHGTRLLLVLLLGSQVLASASAALPLTATVDSSASAIQMGITGPYPSPSQPTDVSGTVVGDVVIDTGVPVQLGAAGGSLAFSDQTFVLDTPAGTNLTLQSLWLGGSLTGPATGGFTNSATSALYDFAGWTLSLDTGTLVGTGSTFGQPIDLLLDLSISPLAFVYPLNSIGLATATDLGGGVFDVTVQFPFDFDTTLLIGAVAMGFSIEGGLVVTGQTSVPEPGTGLLLIAGLVPFARRRRRPLRRANVAALGLLLLSTALVPIGSAHAATFSVNSTGDASDLNPGDGFCITAGLVCTLRAAIEEANGGTALDTIAFALPGLGPQTILVGSDLPPADEPVVIDGYTQPLASPNTRDEGSDAVLLVIVDGQNAANFGITLNAPFSAVRGLVVRNFTFKGIVAGYAATNCVVDGNRAEGNATGISIESDDCRVGGPAPADRNVVGGNSAEGILSLSYVSRAVIQNNYAGTNPQGTATHPNTTGIRVEGTDSFVVDNLLSGNSGTGLYLRGTHNAAEGNWIGTDATGNVGLGGQRQGVLLSGIQNRLGGPNTSQRNLIVGNYALGVELFGNANDVQNNWIGVARDGRAVGNFVPISESGFTNTIGGISPAGQIPGNLGNVIANNTQGIKVFGLHASVLSNQIYDNSSAGLLGPGGIDLDGNGVTFNDPGDIDLGANDLQNFPELIDVIRGIDTRVIGRLDSQPNQTYTLQFFSDYVCDASGYGQGQFFIGTAQATTDATGRADFDVALPRSATGPVITATATDTNGNTSEFSRCLDTGATGADLAISKSVVPAMSAPGDSVVFTVRVDNLGPAVAMNVEITDLLPPQFDYVADTPTAGSYDETTGVWDVGTVSLVTPQFLDIEAQVRADAPASIATNIAERTASSEFDPNGLNDADLASVTIRRGADLQVTQTVDDLGPDIGDPITITVTVENLGPRDTAGVVIRGAVPADLAFVSGLPVTDPSDGFSTNATGWVWQVGDLADGEVAELALEFDVVGGTLSTIHRAFVAASAEEDNVFANNLHALEIGIGGAADLALSFAERELFVYQSSGIAYREVYALFEVRDLGPDQHTDMATLVVSLNFDPLIEAPGTSPRFFVNIFARLTSCVFPDARTATCPLDFAPSALGDPVVIEVTVVPAGSPAEGVITATISSSSLFDPDLSNQSDSTSTSAVVGCFIATAAYGSSLDAHIDVMRDFRDRVLLRSELGRAFVEFYYEQSPPLAAWIGQHESLRALTRGVLAPLVYGLAYPRTATGAGAALALGLFAWTRRRRTTIGSHAR